ncbi:Leucine-rich repeat protein [Coemansia sp. RSA 2399]|nr:Leucine-rich repeat protein [Coemansia sp. RSA 2399]KAJ1903392.1 Leucine-rich repeat protein [Coemansia sp. IMI 209127]
MDTDTAPRSAVPFAHQPDASEASNTFRDNSDSTFIVNPKPDASADPSRMRQRPPVSASDFNHMFSPLALERMFQQNAALVAGDDGSDAQTPSISGLLWQDREARPSDDTFEGAGNTLQQLLSNGSNPVEGGSSSSNPHEQQHRQNEQRYSVAPSGPVAGYQGMLISPFSPPDTASLMGSVNMSRRSLEAMRPASAIPPSHAANHRRSVQIDPRRLPPVPRSVSRASIVSMASTGGHPRYGPAHSNDEHRSGSALAPAPQLARHSLQQLNERSQMHASSIQRPSSSNGNSSGYPVDTVVYGQQQQQQADMSLRHEVLDKVARKSQPQTPYDMQMMPLSSVSVPQSPVPRPATADIRPAYEYSNDDDIVTMLPGDTQPRPYVWGTRNHSDPRNKQRSRNQHQKTPSLHKAGTVSRIGSMRKLDYPGISQARKTSDGSAHLLTPNDFHAPLPYRVGDMVLDKEIGEWVHISEFVQSSANGSPVTRGSPSTAVEPQQTHATVSRGPASGRSSVSQHSHLSAFPLPLPVENKDRSGSASTAYGMGLISPVENQRKVVHEMAERKAVGRRESAAAVRRRPIEDEALGSIVQRLMMPAASPDGCTALDLSGSGIRNLAGLAQITSRLEAICLTGNKLRGLSGLPTGLVSLKAPSNWIRFSALDSDRFLFARELPHLEEIDLSSNEISDIHVFSGLRHLRVLDLSRNRIESLAPLRGCRRLLHLALRDNSLSVLDLDASETPLLSTLDVCNNRLRVVPASIGELKHLVKANMVRNDLECIEFHGPPAESIRELRLSENPLVVRRDGGVVDVRVWSAKFPSLRTLYLDVCNIRAMTSSEGPDDASHVQLLPPSADRHAAAGSTGGWPSLLNLSLRGSALQPSLSVAFESLSQLKNLYAPDTHIVLPRSLPLLSNLLQLVLPNAGLSQLPSNMGAALPHLRLLDISNNPELTDFMPILQLAPSLEVLRCRAVGFGGLANAADNGGGFNAAAVSADERAMLRWLSKLKRLRRLDFRFNKCTFDLYAPPAHSNGSAAGAGGTNALLEAVLSPQLQSPHVMGGDTPNSAAMSVLSPNPAQQQQQCHAAAGRVDEDAWLRNDHAYLANLKMGRHARLIQRRDDYWIAAISLFPRLEELDGIKVGLH